jgi:hypothetical protein
MIIFIEGLSCTGKTYLIDKLIKMHPEWIRFKGAGAVKIGMQQRWQEYNFWLHNNIERLDEINDYKKVILWDRGLTDSAYSEDENYRSEILRVSKSHIKKCAIFIAPKADTWKEFILNRNTKEGSDAINHDEKYLKIISSFKTHHITLKPDNFYITDDIIEQVINFINLQLNA